MEDTIEDSVFADWLTGTNETERVCAFLYPQVLKEVLSRRDWDFAKEFADLGDELEDDDLMEGADYDYQFSLPADFVRLLNQIDESDHKTKYEHDLRYNTETDLWCLLTNYYSNEDGDSAYVEYIYLNDDPASYTPAFVEAFATLFGSEFAAFHKDMQHAMALREAFELLILPIATTANQKHTYKDKQKTWLEARRA